MSCKSEPFYREKQGKFLASSYLKKPVRKMCLIAGGRDKNIKSKLITMIKSGQHRGRDSFGVWTNRGVLKSEDFSEVNEIPNGDIGLLQCRLAMTGSKSFTQPFYNEFVSGSGTEFSTGYESIGTETSSGGMSKIFIIHSRAKGPRGERRNLQVLYRKIIGVPGR